MFKIRKKRGWIKLGDNNCLQYRKEETCRKYEAIVEDLTLINQLIIHVILVWSKTTYNTCMSNMLHVAFLIAVHVSE